MSNIDEDDDAFLYGDDTAPAATTEGTASPSAPGDEGAGTDGKEPQRAEDGEEDADEDDDEEDEDDDDSDSDIEFIIGTEEAKVPTTSTGETSTTTATEAQTAAGIVPEAMSEVMIETDQPAVTSTDATISRVAGVDINKVGEFEGKPITSINLQDLKEKPWRRPGTDLSSYFNFGFDEVTWSLYCAKQDKLRANYNTQKVMMEMMPLMMGNMNPAPAMPGLPQPPAMPMLPSFPTGIAPPPGFPMPPQLPSLPTAPQSEQQGGDPNNLNPDNNNGMSLPQGPAGFNPANLPRAPQRPADFRDKSDRDVERNTNQGFQQSNYRDRDNANRRGRYRNNRR